MRDIDDYLVVCDENLQNVINKVNDLIQNYGYELSGNLFVVYTDYKLNIVLSAGGKIKNTDSGQTYSGSNSGAGNPTWKNIYHQVLIHRKNNNAPKYNAEGNS